MMIFVPGGVNVTLLKSCIPLTYAHTDKFGLVLEERNKMRVRSLCRNKRPHSVIGKS